MGISDLQFDILDELQAEVAHLPHPKRRRAFLELARDIAKDFLHSAEYCYFCEEDHSSSSASDASGSEEPAKPSPSKLRRLS